MCLWLREYLAAALPRPLSLLLPRGLCSLAVLPVTSAGLGIWEMRRKHVLLFPVLILVNPRTKQGSHFVIILLKERLAAVSA